MKKYGKIIIILLLTLSIIFSVSCKDSKTYINEVITQKVEYKDNISVTDIEDALVQATKKAEQSVIGVEASGFVSGGFGSGVIIKSTFTNNLYKYYVVTNFHVISYNDKVATNLNVYLGEQKSTIKAKCEVFDIDKDIAILSFSSPIALSVATIGDSLNLEKGRYALAIGNPYDLKTFYGSVSIGNISYPNRIYQDDINVTNYYIQHTAPINAGNSGGGLFDIYGNLIGINTWKFADEEIEGMGFSIPIHIVQQRFPEYFK